MELPEKFLALKERLPHELIQAKNAIELAEETENERKACLKKWEKFKEDDAFGLILCYLSVNALGPCLIFILDLPMWTWILILLFWISQILVCIYEDNRKVTPGGIRIRKSIYPEEDSSVRFKEITMLSTIIWKTFGFPHWIYRYGQMLKLKAEELKSPRELQDDRLPALRSFFHNMEAWDFNVKMINRLIDQAELGLIPLEDIASLIAELRADEKYLCDNMEYARRLLLEGKLGTSIGANRSADEIVDQIDGRLTEIVEHQKELHELSGKIAARMEVFAR
ncbi:hypothetical protein HYV70_00450 [Candidatus Uhrbacteria bacterium]|nr:hypothetical protein [Candidatus Uhrbacteria bacterium]